MQQSTQEDPRGIPETTSVDCVCHPGIGGHRRPPRRLLAGRRPWQQLGDGAVQTKPSELVRWAAEYWDTALDCLGIDDRLDRAVPVPGEIGAGAYGAGIFATDDDELGQVLTHSGGWGGFVTVFAVAPDLEVAIAATCTSPESASRLVTDGDPERELLDIWAATV